jgi:hypothetical protein
MNSTLAQLAHRAGITVTAESEKFAELLVRECIAQCEKNAEHEWLSSGSKLSAFNIKQHFGVEE